MPLDATPFIEITPRGHRPRIGKEARVPLGGARVTPATAQKLTDWMTQLDKSRGITLDLLVAFGVAHGFVKPVLGAKKPALTTTSHAGQFPKLQPHSAAAVRSVKSKPVS